MTLVLVLGLVVVVGVVAAGAARRLLVDERQSVRDYQQTLDTLRHIGARGASALPDAPQSARSSTNGAVRTRADGAARTRADGGSTPAPENEPATGPEHAGAPAARRQRERRTTRLASSSGAHRRTIGDGLHETPAPLVFDESATTGAVTPTPAVREIASGRLAGVAAREQADARRRPAVPRRVRAGTGRGPSSGALVAAGAVLLVGAVVAAVLTTSSKPPKTAASGPVVRAAAGHATSAPAPTTLLPLTSSSFAATYRAPARSYTVALSASGPCWVMATDTTGHVLWTGTLAAGQSRDVPGTGGMLVRFGAARNVTLTADGRPVQLPPGPLSPFVVTFTAA